MENRLFQSIIKMSVLKEKLTVQGGVVAKVGLLPAVLPVLFYGNSKRPDCRFSAKEFLPLIMIHLFLKIQRDQFNLTRSGD